MHIFYKIIWNLKLFCRLKKFILTLCRNCRNLVIRETNATTESLTELRSQIDKLDDELLELLSRRMRVSRDIGQYKKEHNMPVLQAQRYEELLARRADQAIRMGMDREFMRSVLQAIHEESIRQQMAVLGE